MKMTLLLAAGATVAMMAAPAAAQNNSPNGGNMGNANPGYTQDDNSGNPADTSRAARAAKVVNNAVQVVARMDSDQQLHAELAKAHGLFIVPNFTQGGFIVGGSGGTGLLMIHDQSGRWTDPSFYNIGGISFGAQAGGSNGAVAFLLMSNRAVKAFMAGNEGGSGGNNNGANHINLNSSAGLTVAAWSARAQASSAGDVLVWSNQNGAFAGAKVGGHDISWNRKLTQAYYGSGSLTQDALFYNRLRTNKDERLQRELPNQL